MSASERDERMKLYEMQNFLLEHKYPHNQPMMPDYIISYAGDVFREVAGRDWPSGMYLGEKLGSLATNILRKEDVDYWWWTVEAQRKDNPSYSRERDMFLQNLDRVYKATSVAHISFDRKEAMLAALRLQWALAKWFQEGPTIGWSRVKQYYTALKQKAQFFYGFRGY